MPRCGRARFVGRRGLRTARTHPTAPAVVPGRLEAPTATRILARALAPFLYIQRDEWFPLERVVAVVHPTRPIIAYHLLWQRRRPRLLDSVHRADRRGGRLGRLRLDPRADGHLDVLARNAAPYRLARPRPGRDRRPVGQARIAAARHHRERSAGAQEAESVLRVHLDRAAGHLARRSHPPRTVVLLSRLRRDIATSRSCLPLGERIDAVVRAEDATDALVEVFGRPYSKKTSVAVTGVRIDGLARTRDRGDLTRTRVSIRASSHARARALLPQCPILAIL